MSVFKSDEDKLIISKAYDAIELSKKRFSPCFYGFLNEHESSLLKCNLNLDDTCVFWGGYSDAIRVVFGANVSSNIDFPIIALKFEHKPEYKLSHRDFLGSLMALGIERSTVGDILVFDSYAIVLVKEEIARFIESQVSKIGRVGVKISRVDCTKIEHKNEFDLLNFTVSSLRLDVFVSAVCSLSREKSLRLIKSDLVSVNHCIENNNSKTLVVSDVITIRKFGKFVFAEDCGLSKKGKIKIKVKHFR
ncbi:MAG: hypothetical protein E7513_00875 [Ruminococcaceae bacterium]|nr:hypothetical protein [Oscillospiraceae bacterium]